MIEPDVYFANPAAGFFEKFESAGEDVLGIDIVSMQREDHRYASRMPDIPIRRAIFALTRFSGRAIDASLKGATGPCRPQSAPRELSK